MDLGEDAMVPAPEYPLLQYATGLPAQRPKLDAQGSPQYDGETGEALMDNLYYAGFSASGYSFSVGHFTSSWFIIFNTS